MFHKVPPQHRHAESGDAPINDKPADAKRPSRTAAYAVGAVALVLLAAAAMAIGGQMANVGPWADDGSSGHGMGAMRHGAGSDNTTCGGEGGGHSSGENRREHGNATCGGNWAHGPGHGG